MRSVAIGIWIGVGSRDEAPRQAGVTHFLEHLLFKGTRRFSARDIAETFDGIGAELNAATTREYTVVYARVLDDHLPLALDVMTDMVFMPTFAELDQERDVVLEEIAMFEDAPQDLVHDLMSEAIFPGHPLGRPVIGHADVISSVSKRSLAGYHRDRYHGDNIVVAAAGSVQHDELARLARRLVRQKAPRRGPARRPRSGRTGQERPSVLFHKKATEQVHLCVGARGVARSDPRRFAASVLDSVLGGSASSRLFQEIREKRGLAYAVYTFACQYEEAGEVGVYVGTREENLETCLSLIGQELDAVASGAVSGSELDRARENLKGRVMLSLESTGARMNRLGRAYVTDSELLTPEEILERVDAVTADDVAGLAAELLTRERLSVAAIGPSARRVQRAIKRLHPALAETM